MTSFRDGNRTREEETSFLHHFVSFKRERGGLKGAEEQQGEEEDGEEWRKGKRIRTRECDRGKPGGLFNTCHQGKCW